MAVLLLVIVPVKCLGGNAESKESVIPGLTLSIPRNRKNTCPEVSEENLHNATVLREIPNDAHIPIARLVRTDVKLVEGTWALHFIFLILTTVEVVLTKLIRLRNTFTTLLFFVHNRRILA